MRRATRERGAGGYVLCCVLDPGAVGRCPRLVRLPSAPSRCWTRTEDHRSVVIQELRRRSRRGHSDWNIMQLSSMSDS